MCVNFNDCLTGGLLHYVWDDCSQCHLAQSYFNVCNNLLVYRSHCNLDRYTHSVCLVAIVAVCTQPLA